MPFQSGNLLVAASSSGQFSIGQSWTNFGKDAKANRGGGRITDILDIPDLGAYCKILGCLGKAPGSTGGGAQVTEPDADWPDRFAIPPPTQLRRSITQLRAMPLILLRHHSVMQLPTLLHFTRITQSSNPLSQLGEFEIKMGYRGAMQDCT